VFPNTSKNAEESTIYGNTAKKGVRGTEGRRGGGWRN